MFKYLAVTTITGLFVLLAISPCVIAEDIPFFYYLAFEDPPKLYFHCNQTWGGEKYYEHNRPLYSPVPTGYDPSLVFGRDNSHQSSEIDYGYYGGWIDIYPEENLTIAINGLKGRVYNPDIQLKLIVQLEFRYWIRVNSSVNLTFQLKCDGDGDGTFEYIAYFPETKASFFMELTPSYIDGVPKVFTNGTIELEIHRFGDITENISIYGGPNAGFSYIQVPFDKDTDSDGIGDYSDLDDDGDGYPDSEDFFPKSVGEWKDSDGDFIGDNKDQDDNNNGIPDVYDLPLAMLIISIPIILPIVVLYLNRRDKAIENKKNQDNPPNKPQNQ